MTYATEHQEIEWDVIASKFRDLDLRPAIGGLALYATILSVVMIAEVFF